MGETCQFSYINLGKSVKNGDIDYSELEKTVATGVRFLDDVVEYNILKYSNEVSQSITKNKRKIGLGVCGFANLLDKLGIDYKSQKARETAEDLFSFINFISKKASADLAKERGPFEKFNESKYTTENNIFKKYSNYPTNKISEK